MSAILVCPLFLLDFHWSTAISTRPVVCATDIEGMLFPATPSAVHLSATALSAHLMTVTVIMGCWKDELNYLTEINMEWLRGDDGGGGQLQ